MPHMKWPLIQMAGNHMVWAISFSHLIFWCLIFFSDGVPAFEIERNSKLFESEDAKDICSWDRHMAWARWWGDGSAGDQFEDWEFDWFKVLLDTWRGYCSVFIVTRPYFPFRNNLLVSVPPDGQLRTVFTVDQLWMAGFEKLISAGDGKIQKQEIIQQQEQHCLIINIGLWIKN